MDWRMPRMQSLPVRLLPRTARHAWRLNPYLHVLVDTRAVDVAAHKRVTDFCPAGERPASLGCFLKHNPISLPFTFVFFDGLILKHLNGKSYALHLSWHDGRWHWYSAWLGK